MRFLSNFGGKMSSVNVWLQQDSNSLFKGSIGHMKSSCMVPISVASRPIAQWRQIIIQPECFSSLLFKTSLRFANLNMKWKKKNGSSSSSSSSSSGGGGGGGGGGGSDSGGGGGSGSGTI